MRNPRSRRSARSRASSARASRRPETRPGGAAAVSALLLASLALTGCGDSDGDGNQGHANRFDAPGAMAVIRAQVAVGQRPAGSEQLRELAEVLRGILGSRPEPPDAHFEPVPSAGPQRGLRNIVAVIAGRAPAILIGAHYDTEYHPAGFVGANDGAAGTAAVLELARALPEELPEDHREVRFVLFDGEEEARGCPEENVLLCGLRGSRAYAAAHPGEIGEMILLDYIAHRGARFPREDNSTEELWDELRAAAEEVGTEAIFPDATQPGVLDDHVPFLQQGVPSIDLIDFSYRYADTIEDTVDKLDPAVLDQVGETVAQLVINLSPRD